MSSRVSTTTTERSSGFRTDMSSMRCFPSPPSHLRLRFHKLWQERFRAFMSLSINTARKLRSARATLLSALFFSVAFGASAQELHLRVPSNAVAGQAASIATTGSGSATFYLNGPSISLKRDVQLGQNIDMTAKEMQSAGRYIAVICTSACSGSEFFVA